MEEASLLWLPNQDVETGGPPGADFSCVCVCVCTSKLFATLVSHVDLQGFQLQQNLLIIPESLFTLPPANTGKNKSITSQPLWINKDSFHTKAEYECQQVTCT